MTETCLLSEKKCIPCEGGIPPLEKKEIDKLLAKLQLNSKSFRQDEFKSKPAERTKVREHRLSSQNSLVSSFSNDAENEWQVNELGHLHKRYKFPNFIKAMEFANKIAEIAEQEAHHPDLTISWGACNIEIWTHKINGLTESDFILAAKIDIVY